MTQKKILNWAITIFVALGGLAVVGMAAQWWISKEVKAQLAVIDVPEEVVTLGTDMAVMKTDIANINTNVNTALQSQQRFEEIFLEYLSNEANR